MKLFSDIRSTIGRNVHNILGWKTNRKIVVIESDDWGTIRLSSKAAYNRFKKKGYPVDECAYNKNDSLESNEDLELLFEVLSNVKDVNGKSAKITANTIVANPDFDKIREEKFNSYYYEPFTDSLKRYSNHNKVYDLYKEGILANLFIPQFHGREHVNIARWLKDLREGKEDLQLAFEENMFTVHSVRDPEYKNEYMDAFNADSKKHLELQSSIVKEGLDLFRRLFGYSSSSFIAPCYIWHKELEGDLLANGVNYLQGVYTQKEPSFSSVNKYGIKYHYQGQQNELGQHYLIRNVFFEPSFNESYDWVSDCMKRIEVAFAWRKPAIISSHRVNYIGSINPDNRGNSLKLLKSLLVNITRRWPDVNFLTSSELGDIINKQLK